MTTIKEDDKPALFNVEHVTRAGIELAARDLTRADAERYLTLARIERAPGRCTRVVLAGKVHKPALAGISHRVRARSLQPLSAAQYAAIMAEDEGPE